VGVLILCYASSLFLGYRTLHRRTLHRGGCPQ
jgi:hypothetical protein